MKNKLSFYHITPAFAYLLLCFVLCACNPSVEAGQIRVKSYFVDNPFKQTQTDTLYILEVKGEWMKYKKGNKIDSDRLSLFRHNAKCIK